MKPSRKNFVNSAYTLTHQVEALGVEVYRDASGRYAMGFSAKRQKPDFHFSFRSPENADKYVADWLAAIERRAAEKTAHRARETEPHALKVGDVLRASWGYEQTNIDYYEVTALIGRCMVEIREIAQSSETTEHMAGQCVPCPGRYVGEPMRRRAKAGGTVKVSSCTWASFVKPLAEVDGVKMFAPSRFSCYA